MAIHSLCLRLQGIRQQFYLLYSHMHNYVTKTQLDVLNEAVVRDCIHRLVVNAREASCHCSYLHYSGRVKMLS